MAAPLVLQCLPDLLFYDAYPIDLLLYSACPTCCSTMPAPLWDLLPMPTTGAPAAPERGAKFCAVALAAAVAAPKPLTCMEIRMHVCLCVCVCVEAFACLERDVTYIIDAHTRAMLPGRHPAQPLPAGSAAAAPQSRPTSIPAAAGRVEPWVLGAGAQQAGAEAGWRPGSPHTRSSPQPLASSAAKTCRWCWQAG
eukprot:scaffold65364_cov16-Tisochrysis_lutea.AAC.1